MIKLNKTKTMKTKEQSKKLIDILRGAKETNEETALVAQTKQGHINTQQEILDLEGKLHAQETVINAALQSNPFSASKLYAARKEKQLLELKLQALKEILTELF